MGYRKHLSIVTKHKDISNCLGMNIKQTYLMLKQVLPIEVWAKDEKIIQLLKLLRLLDI